MYVEGGNRQRNLLHAEEFIAAAATHGADIALLPEAMDLGWTHPSCISDADSIPEGETCRRLRKMAREHGMYICSGLVEKTDDQIYDSAVMIDRAGNILLVHKKINELEIGHAYYGLGDRLGVCRTELGTIGLMIVPMVLLRIEYCLVR